MGLTPVGAFTRFDQRQKLLPCHPEAGGRPLGERRFGNTGNEPKRRELMRIELDLKKSEPRDRRMVRDARGELKEVRRDERLRRELGQKCDDELEDLLAFGRIGAGTELVQDDHRTEAELFEKRTDANELRAETSF